MSTEVDFKSKAITSIDSYIKSAELEEYFNGEHTAKRFKVQLVTMIHYGDNEYIRKDDVSYLYPSTISGLDNL